MTSTTNTTAATVQVNRVYIKASRQRVWDAITKPEWTQRYGYTALVEYDLRPGGKFQARATEAMKKSGVEMGFEIPDVTVDGEVIEADPPHRLVQTWRMLMDPALEAEGFTRLTYEIEEAGDGVSKLTVIHDVSNAPGLAALGSGQLEHTGAGGGWAWILSDLKSLLETGAPLNPATA